MTSSLPPDIVRLVCENLLVAAAQQRWHAQRMRCLRQYSRVSRACRDAVGDGSTWLARHQKALRDAVVVFAHTATHEMYTAIERLDRYAPMRMIELRRGASSVDLIRRGQSQCVIDMTNVVGALFDRFLTHLGVNPKCMAGALIRGVRHTADVCVAGRTRWRAVIHVKPLDTLDCWRYRCYQVEKEKSAAASMHRMKISPMYHTLRIETMWIDIMMAMIGAFADESNERGVERVDYVRRLRVANDGLRARPFVQM